MIVKIGNLMETLQLLVNQKMVLQSVIQKPLSLAHAIGSVRIAKV